MSPRVVQTASPVANSEQTRSEVWLRRLKTWSMTSLHHFKKHVGVGVVCSVAYFDPGNWSVDLQAGSEFGYKLLFIVLVAGLMAVIFQAMAAKLGCVTGMDLASHCRMLLYNRPKHTLLYRWLLLYPLYCLCEIAIISTDLAELLGSATALTLLFPALPLWAGVLLTTGDVLFILALGDPTRGKPVRFFELLIGLLVVAVFVCLIVVIVRVSPDWGDAFKGFLPSSTLIKPDALYISVGIIGATVMPHGLFLGSSLARADRAAITHVMDIDPSESLEKIPAPSSYSPPQRTGLLAVLKRLFKTERLTGDAARAAGLPDCTDGYAGWENNQLTFVRAHLAHGVTDVVMSLLGFAVAINSMILILAAAVFFSSPDAESASDLFSAFDVIGKLVGKPAAILFAIALLCAGQSASITATVAGQIVSEGFIRWHISPLLRRLLTRLLGLIPSMAVAVAVGRPGINTLLVLSQVILSIVLPFVALPLVWLTSNSAIMSVVDDTPRAPRELDEDAKLALPDGGKGADAEAIAYVVSVDAASDAGGDAPPPRRVVDYKNGRVMQVLGYLIWLVILIANGYVIVTLALGDDG